MEDLNQDYNKIRQLFEESIPNLPSDKIFMERIETGIRAIETVKADFSQIKKQNRISALLSCGVGFISGIVLTLLYPFITTLIQEGIFSFMKFSQGYEVISKMLAWCIIAIICVAISIGTYISSRQLAGMKRYATILKRASV